MQGLIIATLVVSSITLILCSYTLYRVLKVIRAANKLNKDIHDYMVSVVNEVTKSSKGPYPVEEVTEDIPVRKKAQDTRVMRENNRVELKRGQKGHRPHRNQPNRGGYYKPRKDKWEGLPED